MLFQSTLAFLSAVALTATAAPAPIMIGADDIILHGNGKFQVMKRSELDELEAYRNGSLKAPMPNFLNTTLTTLFGNETVSPGLNPTVSHNGTAPKRKSKRDDKTLIIPNPEERFLGWDTLMSGVVHGAPTTILVAAGYSISNSISVSQSVQITYVKDFLQSSTSISYDKTWTTTQTQTFSAAVPAGKYGAFVSNAWTVRQSGNVWTGTVGQDSSTLVYYQADSFSDRSYGNLDWVDGVISLCTGDEFPLKRCLGDGTL